MFPVYGVTYLPGCSSRFTSQSEFVQEFLGHSGWSQPVMVGEVCRPLQGPTEREGNGAIDGLTEELPQAECLRCRLGEFLGLLWKHVVR